MCRRTNLNVFNSDDLLLLTFIKCGQLIYAPAVVRAATLLQLLQWRQHYTSYVWMATLQLCRGSNTIPAVQVWQHYTSCVWTATLQLCRGGNITAVQGWQHYTMQGWQHYTICVGLVTLHHLCRGGNSCLMFIEINSFINCCIDECDKKN